jgi:hypothetical protein
MFLVLSINTNHLNGKIVYHVAKYLIPLLAL